jgi:hypothetical protein
LKSGAKLLDLGRRILELKRSFKIALVATPLLLLAVLLFPFQSVVIPGWSLRIVDESDQPVTGVNVTEHWQHYLLEAEGHDDPRITDGLGKVDFPERVIRASLLSRAFSRVQKSLRRGEDARTDCYAAVVVWGSREFETAIALYQESAPAAKVVLNRNRVRAPREAGRDPFR